MNQPIFNLTVVRVFHQILQQVLLTCLFFISFAGYSQQPSIDRPLPPFYDDVMDFVKQDSLQKPPLNKILFIGSSSFTMWKDVGDYFPGHTIINRGFGGSSLPDLMRYQELIVYPYEPKQILIYCGENDLAASDTVSADMVYTRFLQLFADLRNRFPDVNISFVSMKPSPSRMHMQQRLVTANKSIRDFLATKKNTAYIDVYTPMLGADGQPLPDIFLEDKLHMNAKGYAIWQKQIKPYLLK